MTWLVPLILVAVLASTAAADRVVIVVGNSKDKELMAITIAAREAAEQARWTAVSHKLPPERVAEVIQCSIGGDSRCIGQLLDEVGADRLIALRLADETYHDQPVRVVYGSILRRGAEVLAAGQRYCEGCRDDLLADRVRSLVTDLVRDARRKVHPATVVVRSIPPRAHVKIDGESVGPADSEFPVTAGAHTLEVAMKDYRAHSQEIDVEDGQRLEIEARLVPVHGEPDARPGVARAPDRRLGPWLAIGSGAALMAAGGIFIALDEDEVQHGTVVPEYRDSMTGGVVLAAAGAVVVTAGIVWLTRARKKPVIAPAFAPQGGSHLGISGRL